MKFNLRYFVTAIAMLACAFCGTSCSDDDDDNGPANTPAVTLADADAATENSLSFIITPSNAEVCSYICQEADKAAPTAEDIISRGRAVSAETATTAKVRNLNANTDYTIYAAAAIGQAYSTVARLTLTTLEHQIVPSVAVVKGAITENTATFTVTPTDAEKCAYVVVKKGETVPEAAAILADGTEAAADKASEVTVENLDENTEYVFAVAVSHGQQFGEVSETAFTTAEAEKIPTANVEAYLYESEAKGWTKWNAVFADITLTNAVSAKVICAATSVIESAIGTGENQYESYAALVEDAGQDLEDDFLTDALSEEGLGLVWSSNIKQATSYTIIVAAKGSKGTVVEAHASVTTESEPLPDPVESALFTKLLGNFTATSKISGQTGDVDITFDVEIAAGDNAETATEYRNKNMLLCKGFGMSATQQIPYYGIKDLMDNKWPADEAKEDYGPKFFLSIAANDKVTIAANRDYSLYAWSQAGNVYLLGQNGQQVYTASNGAFDVVVSADYNTITIKPFTANNSQWYPGAISYSAADGYRAFATYTADIVLTRNTTGNAVSKQAAPSVALPKFDAKNMLQNSEAVRINDYKLQSTIAPFIVK